LSKIGNQLSRFIHELRRRKTIGTGIAYVIAAWVLVEVSSIVIPAFQGPDWILPTLIIAMVIGLPVVIVLSWIFDFTTDGLLRTDDLDDLAAEKQRRAEDKKVENREIKPSVAVPLGSAQRRQVSLLRCTFDLTSGKSAVFDPELMLSMIPELIQLIDRVAEQFSGYCVDRSGSTFEILFGYPAAYENDALRAVAASFAIIREANQLGPGSAASANLKVIPSIAIQSDLVIIQDNENESEAATVIGNASLVAGWLQTLSASNVITLSQDTFELLGNQIKCKALGEHTNAQTGISTNVYQAMELSSREDVLEALGSLTHGIFGRDTEIALVMDRWNLALDGEDQFAVLRGEPGIGKSTLIRDVVRQVQKNEAARVMPMYCSPFETSNAFHPIIEYFLGPGLGLDSTDSEAQRTASIERLLEASGLDVERSAPLIKTLLEFGSEKDTSPEPAESGEAMRIEMLGCLLALFRAAAKREPLLVIFEDIHWADPSTLEVISMMVNGGSEAGVLCLFTTRPTLSIEWESRSNVTMLDLQRLPRRATENLVNSILGEGTLPAPIIANIVSETGGNPLFVEELTKAVVESVEIAGSTDTASLVLPGTLQQSLASRIDHLGSAKPLLQLCSLLGRRFEYSLLKAVSNTENEEALQQELRVIVNSEFLYQEGAVPDSSYRFKHILMQETAYKSLLKSTRIELHARVAAILEKQFPEKLEHRPELFAYHYGEGGQPAKAVMYWTLACKGSLDSIAIREAIEQAENGLKILQALPTSPERDAAEIRLRSMLGKGMLTLRGYADPQVEKAFARALELCEAIGHAPQLFQLLVGLWMYFFIGGDAEHALALARRLVRIAASEASPAKSLQAHYCYGYTLFQMGKLEESRAELEKALSIEEDDDDFSSESASGDDTRVHVRCVLAHVLWHVGQDSRSQQVILEARELAEEVGNPFGIVFASFMSSWLCMLRRDSEDSRRFAEQTTTIAAENGFSFWLPVANFMHAWSTFDGGQTATGKDIQSRIEAMEANADARSGTGATNGETSLILQIAEDMTTAGNLDGAEQRLEELNRQIEKTGERFFETDALRIRGRLAHARGDNNLAEELYAAAESAARQAGCVSLATRAENDLTALRNTAGGRGRAQPLPSDERERWLD
jgi:class 3 adenylate cyclase/tetratricopeptide (TPR) repeat protein